MPTHTTLSVSKQPIIHPAKNCASKSVKVERLDVMMRNMMKKMNSVEKRIYIPLGYSTYQTTTYI